MILRTGRVVIMVACLAAAPAAVRERADGIVVFGDTGQPFALTHPCIERRATIGYHRDAHRQALADVTAFLRGTLRVP